MSEYKGIDVSKWQGVIDWKKVKAAGVQFAIIRAMYSVTKDQQFERNYTAAKAEGIPIGVYLYSYATTEAAAKKEAAALVKILKGKKLDFPVYFDIEDKVHQKLSKSVCTAITKAFCGEMAKEGYTVGVYSYDSFFGSHLDADIQNLFPIWAANISCKPRTCKKYQMHQYSWKGKIDGIKGDVDMNTTSVWYPSEQSTKPVATATANKTASSVAKLESAKDYDKKLAKSFTVLADALNMRYGAGVDKKILTTLKKGASFRCYGYFTETKDGTIWLFGVSGGKMGFCSKKYLK